MSNTSPSALARRTPGVAEVHDLHVWSLGAGHDAITVHVRADAPDVETGARVERALRDAFAAHGVEAWPFNSGCFATVPVKGDADALRHHLIDTESVGVIAVKQANALRVAFCCVIRRRVCPA